VIDRLEWASSSSASVRVYWAGSSSAIDRLEWAGSSSVTDRLEWASSSSASVTTENLSLDKLSCYKTNNGGISVMRIKQISVKGLFNTFNYIIPLNLADRITILHGPNGYGKTILLNMLDGLFNNHSATNANESILLKIPFTEFQVDFDDENCLLLTKNNGILDTKPFSNQETFQHTIPVHLLDTQRLQTIYEVREQTQTIGRVSQQAQHLANTIQSKLAESTRLSQALDRTFPRRLIEQNMSSISLEELRERLEALEKQRSKLRAAGILDEDGSEFLVPSQIEEHTKSALQIYLEDAEQKLGVFAELARKIELFKEIINKRFLYKQMSVNQEQGFVFTNSHGDTLALTDLSLGEQHELVMLYELLFKVQPHSLVLIDEQEISLHIVWGMHFLEDLQQIMQLVSVDVLMTTHAPDLINDRWDLTVELKAPKT
jgi:predicted ATP-binding protein involved in virulence